MRGLRWQSWARLACDGLPSHAPGARMPGPKFRFSCPVADSMEIAAPSAVAMLPENNKTTALADSETVHQIAFLKPTSEDFGTKPPPRRTHDGLAVLRQLQARAPEQRERRSPAAPWPGVLDPVLRHLDVHTIPDGAHSHPQAPQSQLMAACARCAVPQRAASWQVMPICFGTAAHPPLQRLGAAREPRDVCSCLFRASLRVIAGDSAHARGVHNPCRHRRGRRAPCLACTFSTALTVLQSGQIDLTDARAPCRRHRGGAEVRKGADRGAPAAGQLLRRRPRPPAPPARGAAPCSACALQFTIFSDRPSHAPSPAANLSLVRATRFV